MKIKRWYAHFDGNVEEMDNGLLISNHESGNTPDEAYENFKYSILGKRLVKNARHRDRYEFQVPNEWKENATE